MQPTSKTINEQVLDLEKEIDIYAKSLEELEKSKIRITELKEMREAELQKLKDTQSLEINNINQ